MAEETVYAKLNLKSPKPAHRSKAKIPQTTAEKSGHSPGISLYVIGILLMICVSLLSVSIWLGMKVITRCSSDEKGHKTQLDLNRSLQREENLTQILQDANHTINCLRKAATDYSSKCPPGWTMVNQKCYFFSVDKKTREESERFCVESRAVLATVRSKDSILKLYIEEMKAAFWVGLQRISNTHWIWSDNTEGTVTVTEGAGSCAALSHNLILENCYAALRWICGKDAEIPKCNSSDLS